MHVKEINKIKDALGNGAAGKLLWDKGLCRIF
jgi:hypothetical protein